MKNNIIIGFVLLLFANNLVFAQEKRILSHGETQFPQETVDSNFLLPKLSPVAVMLLMEMDNMDSEHRKNLVSDTSFIKKYALHNIDGVLFVNSFLHTYENFSASDVKQYNVRLNNPMFGIQTALVPIESLRTVAQIPTIKQIEISFPSKQLLDNARACTWVDAVHSGSQLPGAYTGTGVVVGIIDQGFDYTHPMFDDNYGNCRIKRVWEQLTSGTPPADFSYGRELVTASSIENAGTDMSSGSHATHVAGIAGGNTDHSSYGWLQALTGVAKNSDLVFVATDMSDQGIWDGICYIMSYAQSVGKPCVINMSMGKHLGSHDGNSTFDLCCDALAENTTGVILVGAAGNAGTTTLYCSKVLTSNDSYLETFPVNSSTNTYDINIWGQPNQSFQVSVEIYDVDDNESISSTAWKTPSQASNGLNWTLQDDDILFPDNISVFMQGGIDQNTNKQVMIVSIDNSEQDDNEKMICLRVYSTSGEIQMWAYDNMTTFSNFGYTDCVSGSTTHTVSEIGGIGRSMISVGSYNSKNTWLDWNDNTQSVSTIVGARSSFSSKGPTADGRMKPDITAPGSRIMSSVNHYNTSYNQSNPDVYASLHSGNTYWYWACMDGTSMASPMVTGIIALWLQGNPMLTIPEVKDIIRQTAYTDSYTGSIGASGSNLWGWGKINAHEGMKLVANTLPTPTISCEDTTPCEGETIHLTADYYYSEWHYVQWSNGQEGRLITVTESGTYRVRLVSATDQTVTSEWSSPVTITFQPHPIPEISGNLAVCAGTQTELTASNGATYLWSNGDTTETIIISPTVNQNYSVTATSAYGCTGSASVSVEILEAPSVRITCSSDTICYGSSTTLSVPEGDTYSWSSGATTSIINVSPETTTVYSVTITNDNGCSNIEEQIIYVIGSEQMSIIGDDTICFGQTVELLASGAIDFLWSTGETTQSVLVSPEQTTTYTVTGAMEHGCVGSRSFTVTVYENPTAVVSNDVSICAGANATLSATGGSEFLWSTTDTTPSITVSPNISSVYSVIVSNGICSDTAQVTVTVMLSPNLNISGNLTICSGNNTMLLASGADRYQWSTGDTTTFIIVAPISTTTYSVVGMHQMNSCMTMESVTVNVMQPQFTSIVADICENEIYNENGFNVSEEGVYTQNLQTVIGCDSIVTLTLSVHQNYVVNIVDSIVEGEVYTQNGFAVSEQGVYTQNLHSEYGCDSIVTLTLNVIAGIADNAITGFYIKPNPTSGTLLLSQIADIVDIFDITGQKIGTYTSEDVIDLTTCAAGIYFLRIEISGRVLVRKVIKQ